MSRIIGKVKVENDDWFFIYCNTVDAAFKPLYVSWEEADKARGNKDHNKNNALGKDEKMINVELYPYSHDTEYSIPSKIDVNNMIITGHLSKESFYRQEDSSTGYGFY
jgi:hypothetical protein